MSRKVIRCKCRCCKKFFTPDYRNVSRQHYCSAPACRQASKAESQRRWLRKPDNRDYFRDPGHVARVQQWRKRNPGYWKKAKPVSQSTQAVGPQALNPEQSSCNAKRTPPGALQDSCLTEHPAFLGLISLVTGSTLQEDIASTARQVLIRGKTLLGLSGPEPSQPSTIGNHDS